MKKAMVVLNLLFLLLPNAEAQKSPPAIHYGMSNSALVKAYPKCSFRTSTEFDTTFLEPTDVAKMEILYCDSLPMFGMSGKLGVVFSRGRLERAAWLTHGAPAFEKIHALITSFARLDNESPVEESKRHAEWRTLDAKELLTLTFDPVSNNVVYCIMQNDED